MEIACLANLFNVVFHISTGIEYHSKITNRGGRLNSFTPVSPQHEQIPMKDWSDNINWVEAAQFFPHLAKDH